jgi:hypothetical protein
MLICWLGLILCSSRASGSRRVTLAKTADIYVKEDQNMASFHCVVLSLLRISSSYT